MPTVDPNNSNLRMGADVGAYRLLRVVELPLIKAWYYELSHTATGARHMHISTKDLENTFSVALKTVPQDSTGVAHILEHTVLCGSRKYPVRDPFFAMLKRSLSTFMNAFTASDWTMYPFTTQNRKDFYNLMDVYLDAVFFPRLEQLSFKQEGIRLELAQADNTSSELLFKGVVYNEMKGAMSSADQVLGRSLLGALYPETTYRFNSGGDPAVIPQLTYEALQAFHRRHYHPSNAYFYTYGNLPLEAHLSFIQDRVLQHFQRIDPETEVPSQPRWQDSRKVTFNYPLAKSEDPARKYQTGMAWLTADIQDTFEVMVLSLLEQVLLGNAASPLRKALIDSGLGSALCDGAGYAPDNRDTMFVAGLKDVQADAADQIEAIIITELQRLVRDGIDKDLVDAAIHQLEFHRKEITNQPYPYGIQLLLVFTGSWLHGGDPVRTLQLEHDLERLQSERARGAFFENRIQSYFLDNPHRVQFTLVPDPTKEEKDNQQEAAEIQRIAAGLSLPDLERIQQDAQALAALQDEKEDLSVLPTLELQDIPPEVQIVKPQPPDTLQPAVSYHAATGGIFYFAAAVDVGSLPPELLPLVPLFCFTFTRMGTHQRDYVDLARQIDAHTGGIGLMAHARTRFDGSGRCLPFISLNSKCLSRNLPPMFDILKELLQAYSFADVNRLGNLLLEYRAGLESSIVHNGHRLAMLLSARGFTPSALLAEVWNGTHQLRFLKQITADFDNRSLDALADKLTRIAQSVLIGDRLRMALIGEAADLDSGLGRAQAIASGLQPQQAGAATHNCPDLGGLSTPVRPVLEGWSTGTAVSFVARSFPVVRMDHEDAPALSAISKLLRSMYLHREIREKGGAYGGFALYNSEDGIFSFGSYRDPHILATLKAYDGAMAFIRSGAYSQDDIKEAVLQVCSEIDKPDPPGPAARKAFYREILALSDKARQKFKAQLVALNRKRLQDAAEGYFDPAKRPQADVVISSEERLKAVQQQMTADRLDIHPI